MIKNYIKLALKVLLRRKFFTFISLFGISFTLLVVMVVMALLDSMLAPNPPEVNLDRSLFVERIELRKNGSMTIGTVGYYFLDRYIKPMKTPRLVSIHSRQIEQFTYVNGKKVKIAVKLTDSEFWQINEFNFLEGFPFNSQMVENGNRVAVINQKTAMEYFGDKSAVGKFIEVDENRYKIIGVVSDVGFIQRTVYADMWIPFSASKHDLENKDLSGIFQGIILAADKSQFEAIQTEFANAVQKAETENQDRWSTIICCPQAKADAWAGDLLRTREESTSSILYLAILSLILFFMLLPVINLVNMNISRILERASEIGIRKAFGATKATLVGQFITENIILTLLGGAIGLILTTFVLNEISHSTIFLQTDFSLNYRVFFYSLIICIFFGLLSGVLPAYKMSRLHPVQALKGGQK